MFEREHHRRIALVLQALDPAMLAEHHCLFGGGTAIALRYGEYRESVDIGFLVAEGTGYRALRQLLGGPQASALLGQARAKAEEAYGASVSESAAKVVEALRRRPHRLDECLQALRVHTVSRAAVWQRIRDVERRLR